VNITTTTIGSTALAACLALLFAGATACGSEDGIASTPARHGQPAAQIQQAGQPSSVDFSADLIEGGKANHHSYRQQLRAQGAQVARASDGFGDDRRQSIEQSRASHATVGQHAPGYDEALLSEG
jgi:hypothetical protein